jgi:hypothetical protein
MSVEEKIVKIYDAVQETRKRFSKMSEEEGTKIKERINSSEGREMFKKTLDFYSSEFTAKERELLDPLVYEIITGINSL